MHYLFNYLLVEDVKLQQDYLRELIEEQDNWTAIEQGCFDNLEDTIAFLNTANCPNLDVIFLDMDLKSPHSVGKEKEFDGTKILRTIAQLERPPKACILTAYGEAITFKELGKWVTLLGFYMGKPLDEGLFIKNMNELLQQGRKHSIFIPIKNERGKTIHQAFLCENLVSIESFGKNQVINTIHQKEHYVVAPNHTLKAIEEKLSDFADFRRVHKSIILNRRFVTGNCRKYNFLEYGHDNWDDIEQITLGVYKEGVKEWLEELKN